MGLIEHLGTVKGVHVLPAAFHQEDVLSSLTERQRELLMAAKRWGYYEYPRRLSAGELAERVGLSKATLVEHLRKAEVRMMETILAGI